MIFGVLALAVSLGALLLAWDGWRRARAGWLRNLAALGLISLAASLWIAGAGAEIGVALFVETSALLAFAFILTRIERKPSRTVPVRAVEQPGGPVRYWRGAARFAVGGPLGLIAALGVGVLIATRAPGAEQTRLILAGLVVPSLWASAIGWTVTSHRLPLQSATLATLGVAGFGSILLGGV